MYFKKLVYVPKFQNRFGSTSSSSPVIWQIVYLQFYVCTCPVTYMINGLYTAYCLNKGHHQCFYTLWKTLLPINWGFLTTYFLTKGYLFVIGQLVLCLMWQVVSCDFP